MFSRGLTEPMAVASILRGVDLATLSGEPSDTAIRCDSRFSQCMVVLVLFGVVIVAVAVAVVVVIVVVVVEFVIIGCVFCCCSVMVPPGIVSLCIVSLCNNTGISLNKHKHTRHSRAHRRGTARGGAGRWLRWPIRLPALHERAPGRTPGDVVCGDLRDGG